MEIIIEIGANGGSDTDHYAQKNIPLYAIEPVKELNKFLTKKFAHLEHVKILDYAIDIKEGLRDFHISKRGDWGCSSLNQFSDDIKEKWPNRNDFNYDESIKVKVISGENLVNLIESLEDKEVTSIKYLHIDAQGSDLDVLKSFGKKLLLVQEGVCEAAHNVSLYKDVDNKLQSIVEFLLENNFVVNSIKKNDPDSNEVNIYFMRK